MATYDAIVLGVGGVGSAALYHLAAQGLRVLGIDRFSPPHDRGSSHGQTRIIRQAYFEHPNYVPLALASYDLWRQLEATTAEDLLEVTGLVEIGPSDGIVVPGVLQAAAEHHLAVEQLSPNQITQRWPPLRVPPDLTGVYERDGGYLRVETCVGAHLRAATHQGAKLQVESTVRHWTSDGRYAIVTTDDETHQAARLVITAGAWTGRLLSELSIPMTILRKSLLWYATENDAFRGEDGFPGFLYELPYGIFYGFGQLDERGVKVAEHGGGTQVDDPLQLDRTIHVADRRPVERFVAECLTDISNRLTDATMCMYTMSPDEHFLLDRHPGHENVWLCGGLSGHGFKFTPALGKALADLAIDGTTELPVGFFTLGRFQ